MMLKKGPKSKKNDTWRTNNIDTMEARAPIPFLKLIVKEMMQASILPASRIYTSD